MRLAAIAKITCQDNFTQHFFAHEILPGDAI